MRRRSALRSGSPGREATGSRSLDTQPVGGIGQFAPLEGKTTASDACGQIVSKSFELLDPRVELIAPTLGKTGPICFPRRALFGQCVEGITDIGERDSYRLSRPNEGQSPQCVATESPLVPLVTHGRDQTLTLIEVERRDRESASLRHLSDGPRAEQLLFRDHPGMVLLDLNIG